MNDTIKCSSGHHLLDYVTNTFKEYQRLGMLELDEIIFLGLKVDSPEGFIYHSLDCREVSEEKVRNEGEASFEVNLKHFLEEGAEFAYCYVDTEDKAFNQFVSHGRPQLFLNHYHEDFFDLSLSEQARALEEMKRSLEEFQTSYNASSATRPDAYIRLQENFIKVVKLWEESFTKALHSSEVTSQLIAHCAKDLARKLITSYEDRKESEDQGLEAILKESREKVIKELLENPSFVTSSREDFLDSSDWRAGVFENLCLERWKGSWPNIITLPKVVYEWFCKSSHKSRPDYFSTPNHPPENILETVSRLYQPDAKGAYNTLSVTYQAALVLEAA